MNKLKGLIILLALSIAIVFFFFKEPIKNPNSTFFASGGDGLKDYYTTSYFVEYDTCYFHTYSMNYPHGENILFTGNQPSISFFIKFISDNIVDITDYTVAILNLFMLFSIILGTVLLYLLFQHFKLPVIYSIIAAIGITFLSPQIARLAGHFSLSYIFVIPAILYCIVKFHEKPTYWKSIILALLFIWFFGFHVYMIGFYSIVVVLYWVIIFAIKRNKLNYKTGFFHFSIQFLIPVFLILLINIITDDVADRSSYPWGFLHYTAYFQSILLPIGRPYAQFLYKISSFDSIDWEGFAFVGTTAAIGFLVICFNVVKKVSKRQKINVFNLDEHKLLLNVLLIISIIGLLYSFGLPFKLGLKSLVDYIGPLKQMRGIARFSWIFFYVINIYVFYYLWEMRKIIIKKPVYILLIGVGFSFLLYDAYYNVNFWSSFVNNKIPELSKDSEKTPEWKKIINQGNYQAILPLPYFHIGSENIWIEPVDGINNKNFIVSWKTGLPSMGVYLSRTSLSQTIINNQLCWEEYRKPKIISKLNPEKDILLLTLKNQDKIPEPQINLIRKSHFLYENDDFRLYQTPFDSLATLASNLYLETMQEYKNKKLFDHGTYKSDSKNKNFMVYKSSKNQRSNEFYIEKESNKQKIIYNGSFYETKLPLDNEQTEYVLSFWISDIYTDLLLRSRLIFELSDSENTVYDYQSHSLFDLIKTVDKNWALIELTFNVEKIEHFLKFRIRNRNLRNNFYNIDEIMIRPKNVSVYNKTDNYIMKNNRFFLKQNI